MCIQAAKRLSNKQGKLPTSAFIKPSFARGRKWTKCSPSSHCLPNMCKSSSMAVNRRSHCLQRRMRDARQESGVFGSRDNSRQLSLISVVSPHNDSHVK